MKLNRKHLKPLGFKGLGMFDNSVWYDQWYRVFPAANVVIGIGCCNMEGVYIFRLTPKEMKAFQAGKLSLIPPGCCSASHHPYTEKFDWLYKGTFKNTKELHSVPLSTGLFPELCVLVKRK